VGGMIWLGSYAASALVACGCISYYSGRKDPTLGPVLILVASLLWPLLIPASLLLLFIEHMVRIGIETGGKGG
jgi:hypothetical protein